jgi:hypothetical protein
MTLIHCSSPSERARHGHAPGVLPAARLPEHPVTVDPPMREAAWSPESMWSAPPDERHGRRGPGLLGLPGATVTG